MLVLAIGDVIGRPGRQTVRKLLPVLRQKHRLDLVIANGENVAGGIGITQDTAEELLESGVNVITTGNHVWHHKDILPYIEREVPVLRPLNFPPGVPGRGYLVKNGILVVNLIGRVFMGSYDCPFRAMDALLLGLKEKPKAILVDFHAEATSEKVAMGWYLDGRVSAVFGTHTHIGTVDARILNKGTAYVTDVGMAGPGDSVIGIDTEAALQRFLKMIPGPPTVGKGKNILNSVLIKLDEASGRALSIERIDLETE